MRSKFTPWVALQAFVGLLLLVLCAVNLNGQQANTNPNRVVTTCGTPPSPWPAADERAPGTVNTGGQECVTVGGTVTTAAATGYTVAVAWASSITVGASAVTDAALVTVGAGTRVVLNRYSFLCGSTVTATVTMSLGFGAATVPASGAGLVATLPATTASQFQGIAETFTSFYPSGASGEDLRITVSSPTGGACTINILYFTESP